MSYTCEYKGKKYKCSKWLKDKIKSLEKLNNRTTKQEYELLSSYKTLIHILDYEYIDKDEKELNKFLTDFCMRNFIEIFRQ